MSRLMIVGLLVVGVAAVVVVVKAESVPRSYSGEAVPPSYYAEVIASDPELFGIFEQTRRDERGEGWDEVRPDTAQRRAQVAALRAKPRDAAQAAHIMDALVKAYSCDPPNWAVMAVGFKCAEFGVTDPRLAPLARDVALRMDEIPDRWLSAGVAAMAILAGTGQPQHIEFLEKVITDTTFGEVSSTEEAGRRNTQFQAAVSALYTMLPVDQGLNVFQGLEDKVAKEAAAAGSPGDDKSVARRTWNLRHIRYAISELTRVKQTESSNGP